MLRRSIVTAGLCLLALVAGCTFIRNMFGIDGKYLFSGFDAVAVPGETVTVKVRLQSGSLLKDCPNVPVRFFQNGKMLWEVTTDGEGYATAVFIPKTPGDYLLAARAFPPDNKGPPPEPIEVFVACRDPQAPLAIIDLDKTLVASGFKTVMTGEPVPMADSARVMNRIAKDFTTVYLTHRLEYFGSKSKTWLRGHGYPRGPVMLADVHEFMEGSEQYKSAVLQGMRRRFKGRIIGVGDKVSDAFAYQVNGLEAFLLLQPEHPDKADDLRDMAEEIAALPDTVQVVGGWTDIERALFQGVRFPRSQFQADLLRRAGALDPKAAPSSVKPQP